MNKKFIYTIAICCLGLFFAYLEWYFPAGICLGFYLGFVFGVERVFKKATGRVIDSSIEDDVFNKIL